MTLRAELEANPKIQASLMAQGTHVVENPGGGEQGRTGHPP